MSIIPNPLDDVSDENLVMIFRYLNVKDWLAVQRVCKKWKRLGPYLWKKINEVEEVPFEIVPDNMIQLSEDEIGSFINSVGPFINTIKISSCKFLESHLRFGKFTIALDNVENEILLERMRPRLGAVTNLNLLSSDFNEDFVFQMISENKNLNKLSLKGCTVKLFSTDIIFESMKRLTLTINNSDEGTENFHWPFPKIETLNLTINFMPATKTDQILEKILSTSKKIRHLVLNLKFFRSATTFVVPALSHLGQMTDLESLLLTVTGENLCDDFLFNVPKNCKKLQNVELHTNIKKATLSEFLSIEHLDTLIVDGISGFPVATVVLNQLSVFSVTIHSQLDSDDFDNLRLALCNMMPKLRSLSVFNLMTERSVHLTCDAINLALHMDVEPIVYCERYNPMQEIVLDKGKWLEPEWTLRILITEQANFYHDYVKEYCKTKCDENAIEYVEDTLVPYIRVKLPTYQLQYDALVRLMNW